MEMLQEDRLDRDQKELALPNPAQLRHMEAPASGHSSALQAPTGQLAEVRISLLSRVEAML